ncbi:GMC oxidoreductase [Streptomyces sp. NRRL S-1022]|uniref:GMC oxidoreductase n=1 Tax=Streptomyces sp. NRRL S-1022 TaxID=1463880 RepID=UPI00099C5F2F|nr:GMC oxidoreductase [Streptomyces sp. NRRL S-1022]
MNVVCGKRQSTANAYFAPIVSVEPGRGHRCAGVSGAAGRRLDVRCYLPVRPLQAGFASPGGLGPSRTSDNRFRAHERSVADIDLNVHGIRNLRVADASVMPSLISANSNAAV